MKKHLIKRKEILLRLSCIQGNKKYYFFAWLFFSCFIVIFPILIRVFDYLIKQKDLLSILSDHNMYMQIFTFFVVYSALFLLQPRLLESILPFFIAKKGIDSELMQDLAQSYYITDTAQLLQIENIAATRLVPTHQRLYLRLEHHQIETWFTVYTGLLWAKPHLHLDLKLTEHCIGQKIKICYLPQSKNIIQAFAQQNLQEDLAYSKTLKRLMQPLSSENIDHIPSQLQYELLSCQSIKIQPISIHQKDFQLEIMTTQQKQISILSIESHFDLFYSVLQQKYKLPDLEKIEQQISNLSKTIIFYDLPKQIKMMRWALFAISGLLFIFTLWHTFFIFFAIFMLIAALLTKFITSQSNYLKILQND